MDVSTSDGPPIYHRHGVSECSPMEGVGPTQRCPILRGRGRSNDHHGPINHIFKSWDDHLQAMNGHLEGPQVPQPDPQGNDHRGY